MKWDKHEVGHTSSGTNIKWDTHQVGLTASGTNIEWYKYQVGKNTKWDKQYANGWDWDKY